MSAYVWSTIAGLALALTLLVFEGGAGGTTAPPIVEAAAMDDTPAQTAQTTRGQWAIDLLSALGNGRPTKETVDLVVAWTEAEDSRDGPGTAMARNNPINTTQTGYGEYDTINNDGVKAYPDYESGMAATVQTLSYGYYTEIVAGLQTNDPERALRGMYASPWGTDMRNVENIWRGM